MIQLLVALDFFLDRSNLLLVQAQVGVHKLDHFDCKRLASIDV